MLDLDTETHLIDRGQLAPRLVCGSFSGEGLECVKTAPDALGLLREGLGGPVSGANIAYDMAVCAAADPTLLPEILRAYREGRITDTLLNGKLLDIAAGRYDHAAIAGWSLESLCRRIGIELEKSDWRLRFAALDGVPVAHWPKGAYEYALGDAVANGKLREAQDEAAEQWRAAGVEVLGPHAVHAARRAFGLHLASCWGVLTDRGRVAAVKARLETRAELVRKRLVRAGLVRSDGTRDTKAAARVLVERALRAGREVPRTDGYEAALERWRKKADALIAARETAETDAARSDLTPRERVQAARFAVKKAQEIEEHDSCWLNHGTEWTEPGLRPELDAAKTFLGSVQLDHDACVLSGSPALLLYSEYGSIATLRNRVEILEQGHELPLQTRFDPIKETFRTSSTQPMDPLVGDQMQNHPRSSGMSPAERKRERGYKDRRGVEHKAEFFIGLRECFTPRPGNIFVGADYSQAELHTLAQLNLKLFGESEMARLLNADIDLHWHFAAATLGRTYDETKADPNCKKDRQRVKPANFGFPGGMGVEKFILYSRTGYGVNFTHAEAKTLRKQWLATFPEMEYYLAWISRQLGENATFTHVHPITGFVRGGCRYTSGANHGFQHLCAYGAGDAIWAVTDACFDPKSPLYGWRLWNFVHDELLLEGPREGAAEAGEELARLMEQAFNQWVPDVPTTAEPFVTSIWSKSVKSLRDASGRLIEWIPEAQAA